VPILKLIALFSPLCEEEPCDIVLLVPVTPGIVSTVTLLLEKLLASATFHIVVNVLDVSN
jgi:hypothetical protein